jgi:hypothetical protein
MQLKAITKARISALIMMEELNPRGRTFLAPITQGLLERYSFIKFPQTWEDYHPQQGGILYLQGDWNGIAIDRLEIFTGGIAVETRSSTEDSEAFIHEALTWATKAYELTEFKPDMIRRRIYSSQLTFRSDIPLLDALHPQLPDFGERITKMLSPTFGTPIPYKTFGISFGFEPTIDNSQSSLVQIERRAGTSFSEDTYFSSAPFSTKEHLKFLADFETAISESYKRT